MGKLDFSFFDRTFNIVKFNVRAHLQSHGPLVLSIFEVFSTSKRFYVYAIRGYSIALLSAQDRTFDNIMCIKVLPSFLEFLDVHNCLNLKHR